MILSLYQPLGSSTHLLAKKVGDLQNTKATHTGTLDPMAEGVVIVLTDQDRFDKSKYTEWKKTYQFQILFGMETDSLDLLGLTKESTNIPIGQSTNLEEKLNQILLNFIGPQDQIVPNFSAKRIDGESYFDKAKRGEEINPASQRIMIYDLRLLSLETIKPSKLQTNIIQKIKKINGDFRQKEVLSNWNEFFKTPTMKQCNNVTIANLQATTSKRTYIRALVKDIGKKLNIPTTTYSITRTQNGPYSVKDCICLV